MRLRDQSEAVYADIGCLPPLSRIAYATLQSIHEQEFSIDGLLLLLDSEPGCAKRLLAGINASPNRMPAPASSLSGAVAYVGGAQLVRLVCASCFAPYYRGVDQGYQLPPGATFQHSLACGIVAHFLAERTGATRPVAAFTAGLLHDLGKIVIGKFVAEERDTLREALASGNGDLPAAERRIVGLDHAAAGGIIADRWLLPAALRRCIRDHHEPLHAVANEPLTPLVQVADAAAAEIGLGGVGRRQAATDLCDRVGLNCALLREAKSILADELHQLGPMLSMTTAVSV